MPLTNVPSLDQVKQWLKVDDTLDDVALAEGLLAALRYQQHLSRIPTDGPYPDDLRLAVFLRTSRYLSRRSSPDGLQGMGSDLGPVQIVTIDRDIRELEAPYVGPRVA